MSEQLKYNLNAEDDEIEMEISLCSAKWDWIRLDCEISTYSWLNIIADWVKHFDLIIELKSINISPYETIDKN